MAKLDPVVKKETLFIAWATMICNLIVQVVFLLCQEWDVSVLLGGVIGWLLCVFNFFLMSHDIQLAIETGDETQAKTKIRSSYTFRTLLQLAVVVLALVVDCIHWIPVVTSIFFPRIVISIRQLVERLLGKTESTEAHTAPAADISEEPEDESEDGFEKIVRHFGARTAPDYSPKSTGSPSESSDTDHNEEESNS